LHTSASAALSHLSRSDKRELTLGRLALSVRVSVRVGPATVFGGARTDGLNFFCGRAAASSEHPRVSSMLDT
jgi:hypothetical protein